MSATICRDRNIEVRLTLKEVLDLGLQRLCRQEVYSLINGFEYKLYIFGNSDFETRISDYRTQGRLEIYLSKEDYAKLLGKKVVSLDYPDGTISLGVNC